MIPMHADNVSALCRGIPARVVLRPSPSSSNGVRATRANEEPTRPALVNPHLVRFGAWHQARRAVRALAPLLALFLLVMVQTQASVQATLVGDTNRDGMVDERDLARRTNWSWTSGAFVLANLDDDDRDGKPDADDQVVNGNSDERDLARFRVYFESAPMTENADFYIDAGQAPVNVFQKDGSHWRFLTSQTPLKSDVSNPIELGVEARTFAGVRGWNGALRLRVLRRGPNGEAELESVPARVAPWLMLANSAPTRAFYIATGKYDNSAMLGEVGGLLKNWGVAFPTPHQAKSWLEMWMQDSLEIGYTEIPGGGRQHVVLNGIRGADSFGPTLLGPDVGVMTVGGNRGMKGHDAWVDWYGNLEVTHPTREYPFGRIYYGCNTESGATLHPEVVTFLQSQILQDPFWVDTSWLAIKHVDEIFNVLPARDGNGVLIIAQPELAAQVLEQKLDAFNVTIQEKLARTVHGGTYVIKGKTVQYPGLRALLGVPADRIVGLPVLFAPVEVDASSGRPGAHNLWSNPVNSVFLNGNLLVGSAHMPAPVKAEITKRMKDLGVREVGFVNDQVYQDRWGNVHCSSNTLKEPPKTGFWTRFTRE